MTEPDAAANDPLAYLLSRASEGDEDALNGLFPLVYEELRSLARGRLRGERADHTLDTTALVHEAYLKLAGASRVQWQGRAHFYAVASRAMRRILINHAEARRAAKRGGGASPVTLDPLVHVLSDEQAEELLALDDALERLRVFNPRGADVVVQRFFGGLTHEEISETMGLSLITVRRAWNAARSWLRVELQQDDETDAPASGRVNRDFGAWAALERE